MTTMAMRASAVTAELNYLDPQFVARLDTKPEFYSEDTSR